MVRIEYAELRNNFVTIWLRYVKGLNLNISSMKCLKGRLDRRIHSGMRRIKTMELEESPFYYFCAEDKSGRLSGDLHVAFVEAPGEEILIDDRNISLRITGARRIQVAPPDAGGMDPLAMETQLAMSPFWQFASYLAANTQLPREPLRHRPGYRPPRKDRNTKRPWLKLKRQTQTESE